jgi:hypothetical protein
MSGGAHSGGPALLDEEPAADFVSASPHFLPGWLNSSPEFKESLRYRNEPRLDHSGTVPPNQDGTIDVAFAKSLSYFLPALSLRALAVSAGCECIQSIALLAKPSRTNNQNIHRIASQHYGA